MSLPRYDYLYPSTDYKNCDTEWIREQLELAEEEGATEYIKAARKELSIRNSAPIYSKEKHVPMTGNYTKSERKTVSWWDRLFGKVR